jgi:hypothetical protein
MTIHPTDSLPKATTATMNTPEARLPISSTTLTNPSPKATTQLKPNHQSRLNPRSANSYFNNESYLNNEPSANKKHKDFLCSPAHPTSKCNNSDANKPIRLSESTSNNKFFNEEPSDRNHNKKSSPTNRNKDISKNALCYSTSLGGVETSPTLWPDYRPHHFKEGTDGNVYLVLRFPQMTCEFLMARPFLKKSITT